MKDKKQPVKIERSQPATAIPDALDKKWYGLFVICFAIALYINTLTHGFTQDDAIVIYDNMFTTEGISGWKGLFTKDTFFGFFKEEGKANLVSGGRYRPFTPAMFALEYELAGNSPWLGHLINIMLYGLLCLLIFKTIQDMLKESMTYENALWIAFACALVYAAHPVHTEAVANIKGRDEIVSMMGSVGVLWLMFRYHDTRQTTFLFYAMAVFFLALLSKENTVTFLAVIPLALLTFRKNATSSARQSLLLVVPFILFMIIRTSVIGSGFGAPPLELMNNPYVKWADGQYVPFQLGEKTATILYTLGKYIQLLLFPHPLTHDYYPRYIDIMQISDPKVLLSLGIYLLLAITAVAAILKKNLAGFCAFYYLATLSVVSNIVFPIGTNMSERFLFMPSLAFALLAAWALHKWVFLRFGKQAFYIVLILILSGYSLKTVSRNQVWKNDFTLFTTDVKTSVNSAKVLNAAGGALTTQAYDEKDPVRRKEYLQQAVIYLNRALEIHPQYKAAALILGNAYSNLEEYDKAIPAYERALAIDNNYQDALTNLAITLRLAGKQAGEKERNLQKSLILLRRSYQLAPNDMETVRLLGVVHGFLGKHQEALGFFSLVAQNQPKNAFALMDVSRAYNNLGDSQKAAFYQQQAISIDPSVMKGQ
ncbi:MAG: glycosyltransferase family 39 protein [Saprospiraceae bacterium]|jgi:tetratricopeptide (TPR) repeat protein|nr:glycosyltransferase family 39 protein [Saprospiraceae bacterium]